MKYIYDVVLNFQDNYYEFYEWKKDDKIINLKKILIYNVSMNDYINIKNKGVIIKNEELIGKMILITNSIEVIGIMLDKNGKVIKKSSLLIDQMDSILNNIHNIKYIDVKYEIIRDDVFKDRISLEREKYLLNYLNNIKDNEYLLKYIYYDMYNCEEEDKYKIYNKLLDMYKNNFNLLYDNIKKVNMELEKYKTI